MVLLPSKKLMETNQNEYARAIIVPTLTVRNGSDAIAFYQKAFGATILRPIQILMDQWSQKWRLEVPGSLWQISRRSMVILALKD